jgi:hypothetical protein
MPGGLCDRCVFQRLVPTRRSVFTMCEEPRMPRYPAVPVMRCPAFVPADGGQAPPRPAGA